MEKERPVVKPSQTRNPKKKDVELDTMEDEHPSNRQILGDLTALLSVQVETAAQPHRAL